MERPGRLVVYSRYMIRWLSGVSVEQSARISELVGALGVITHVSCVFAYLHSDPFA